MNPAGLILFVWLLLMAALCWLPIHLAIHHLMDRLDRTLTRRLYRRTFMADPEQPHAFDPYPGEEECMACGGYKDEPLHQQQPVDDHETEPA